MQLKLDGEPHLVLLVGIQLTLGDQDHLSPRLLTDLSQLWPALLVVVWLTHIRNNSLGLIELFISMTAGWVLLMGGKTTCPES